MSKSHFVPATNADFVTIDENYTYVLDEGRVSILKNGRWLSRPEYDKAWTAAIKEIQRLRQEVANAHATRGPDA